MDRLRMLFYKPSRYPAEWSLRLAHRLCPHDREEDYGILDFGRIQLWKCTRCGRPRQERRVAA